MHHRYLSMLHLHCTDCATDTDKIAVLGPGALEIIASAAAAQIAAWSYSADAVARPVGSLGRIHCLYRATYHSIW